MSIELEYDIDIAHRIVTDNNRWEARGYNLSSGIYRGTNEMISSKEYTSFITNRERILSVIASGDQILNSILLGSNDVEAFDISRFPQYYLKLKIAAVKTLGRDEFLLFFFGEEETQLFNKSVYDIIRPNLDSYTQQFWDSLFEKFSVQQLINSPLFKRDKCAERIDEVLYKNLYVREGQYDILKSKIGNIRLRLHIGNVLDLDTSGMKGFNLINLSNVMNHVTANKNYLPFKHAVESMPLAEDGIVLNYNIEHRETLSSNGMFEVFGDNFRAFDMTDKRLKENNEPDWLYVYKKKWK